MLDLQKTKVELAGLFPGQEDACEEMTKWLSAHGAFVQIPVPKQAEKYLYLPLTLKGSVISYVRECNRKGFNTTIREIMDHTGYHSTSAVSYTVDSLCKEGILQREPRLARLIRIKEKE